MTLRETSRDEFVAHITENKADAFAKTFVAKADMQEQWQYCIGYWEGNIDSDESNNSAISDISYISRLSSNENDRNFLSTDKEVKQYNGKKKLNLKTLNRKRDEGKIKLIQKWD